MEDYSTQTVTQADMNKRDKDDFQDAPSQMSPDAKRDIADNFTQDMRVIVTTNTRNAWMDDFYDVLPEESKRPTFH